MNYYRLMDNLTYPENRWFLGSINFPNEWDFWNYIRIGLVKQPEFELKISLRKRGQPIDITMADFELLVVQERVINYFQDEEVQFIKVHLDSDTNIDPRKLYLMCILQEIDCVDERKSIFDKWEEGNEIRPDLSGDYKTFYKLVVDPLKIGNTNIFRLKKYGSIIIISELLKNVFESNLVTGVQYKLLTF